MRIDFASEIRERVPIRDLAALYGVEADRHGFAHCPFHQGDRSPSLKLYDGGRGGYHCFACRAHGSVIDWVMQMDGLGFQDACRKLNDIFSLGLPMDGKLGEAEEKALEAKTRAAREKRDAWKREYDAAHKALEAAESRFYECDTRMAREVPLSAEWARAAREIDGAWYAAKEKEWEVNNLLERKRNQNTGLVGERLQGRHNSL